MSMEQALIFLVLIAVAFMQVLKRALHARHTQQSSFEPDDAGPWEPTIEIEPPPPPRPVAPPVTMPPAPAATSTRAARSPQVRPVEPERTARGAIGDRRLDRPELRRAIVMMTILGPPRSLDPK